MDAFNFAKSYGAVQKTEWVLLPAWISNGRIVGFSSVEPLAIGYLNFGRPSYKNRLNSLRAEKAAFVKESDPKEYGCRPAG
jgi:hypothetical protein